MGARAAWAALIALLAVAVGFYSPAAGGFESSGVSVVEQKLSSLIEGVDILNSTSYKNALCPGLDGYEIIRANGNQSCDDGFSAPTHDGPRSRFVALLHAETSNFCFQHANGGPCNRSVSGSLAEIFDLYLRLDSVCPIYKLDISVHDGDISPQLTSCCFFRAANEVAGGHPKKNGRKSQYDSKGNESFIFPVVDKISKAIPIKISPSNERGQVIFRLVFGG